MKKIVYVVGIFILLGGGLLAKELKIDVGQTLTHAQAKMRWGEEKFLAETFKANDPNARTKMAVHLLGQKQNYIGKTSKEIVDLLGRPDGFFFPDTFPAYLVFKDYEKEEAWQIVFLLNYQSKIKDVILQKN